MKAIGTLFLAMAGLVVGSYLYAESSGWLDRTISKWGDFGKVTLPEVFRVRPARFVPVFAVFLTWGLGLIGWTYP